MLQSTQITERTLSLGFHQSCAATCGRTFRGSSTTVSTSSIIMFLEENPMARKSDRTDASIIIIMSGEFHNCGVGNVWHHSNHGPIPYFPKPRPYFSKSFISRHPILFPEIVDLHGLDSGASCFAAPQARKFWGFSQRRKEETLDF